MRWPWTRKPSLPDEERPTGAGSFSCSCGVATGPGQVPDWSQTMEDHLRDAGLLYRIVEVA